MVSRFRFGAISCGLAAVPILIQLTLFGIFESISRQLPLIVDRRTEVVILVLPPVIGLLIGLAGLFWKDRNKIPSIIGVILNLLIAAFYTFLVSFAG